MKRTIFRRITAFALILTLMVSVLPGIGLTASAAGVKPMIIVDMLDRTYPILHGSAGFLYGVSSDEVPTSSLLTPLKPKVLATKGALGTEHPYGDALDVAKTFLESGGEQVQMYNSNYYAIFGPNNYAEDYAEELKNVIGPAVYEWKELWKKDHNADPVTGIDDLGLDIDKAIVYLPINEGSPVTLRNGGNNFAQAWKLYYDAIREADPKAAIAGPNNSSYNNHINMRTFLTFCQANDCWPDVVTWHQLDNQESRWAAYPTEFADYKQICKDLGHEETQVVINEYAAMVDCGVPGRLINFFANFEENQVYACLPFWHQANNLNDIAADANEPNGAWWLYKWYGDMSGDLLKISRRNTTLSGFNGVSTIDDNKRISSTLYGGVDGPSTVILKDLDKTETFKGATKVHVKIDATYFMSFNGMVEPETIVEGTFALENGSLIIEMDDMKFSTGYYLTVTPAKDEDEVGNPLVAAFRGIYEAEDAVRVGNVNVATDGKYYLSGRQAITNFSTANGIDYIVNVPVDGKYKLDFIYGNELGLNRGNEALHKPLNQIQKLSIDDGGAIDMMLKNTMERGWTGIHTEYADLTVGEHKISIRGNGSATTTILHDILHVTYAGAYEQPLPVFDKVYEAELADFNELASTDKTAVSTKADLISYTGSGYVTGLNVNPVTDGGGIRWNVVVQESGLYNVSLRYQSNASGTAGIYIGNTARTFDGFRKSVDVVNTSGEWALTKATIYLQKGVNIVDVDATADIALDNMRVRKAENAAALSQEIKAVDAIPEGVRMTDVEYLVYDVKADENKKPELYTITRTTDKVAATLLPEGIEYVVGRSLTGDPDAENDADKYLEFEVEVGTAGTYAMQVFYSNDEIFGTHSYNTKIIDKFASIKVNDQPAKRYFFINSIARDTFKEKTVLIDLEAGRNTIKIYNDDSWSVLKGLDTSDSNARGLETSRGGTATSGYYQDKPGNIPLVNSLPNLYKFVITPAALAVPLADEVVEHTVNIRTTSGGTAVADKNAVVDGGSITFTITARTELTNVLVNGVSKRGELTGGEQGIYKLTVFNVREDLEVHALFAAAEDEDNENDPDSPIVNNSFGTGDLMGWTLETTGEHAVETNILNRYDSKTYLSLWGDSDYTATLSQSVRMPEGGYYIVSFAVKNLDSDSTEIGEYNEFIFSASAGGDAVEKAIVPDKNYQVIQQLVVVPEDSETVDISIRVDAKAGFEVYLDSFGIEECDPDYIPLTGRIFGRQVSSWEFSGPPENAFDGNPDTYYDGQSSSYVGMEMDARYNLTKVRFMARSGNASRMTGNQVQGSVDGENWDTLYTISGTPANNPTFVTVDLKATGQMSARAYKYFRLYCGTSSYCNVALLEFYGALAEVDLLAESITVDGEPLPGFNQTTMVYEFVLPAGTASAPEVAATPVDPKCSVTVIPAASVPGTTTVKVAYNGKETNYYIDFGYAPEGDNFVDGTKTDSWTIVHNNPDNWSLDKGKGLRLPTLQHDIYGSSAGVEYENVFLQPAYGDWDVVAKVYYPKAPRESYQQVMLLAWQDDDNYIKIDCEGSNQNIQAGVETNGSFGSTSSASGTGFIAEDGSLTLYFRIRKTGNSYTLQYSANGATYNNLGSARTAAFRNVHIGLFATKNSSNAIIDTYVEYVSVLSAGGVQLMTPEQMLQNAVNSVLDYVVADIPATATDSFTLSDVPHGYTLTASSDKPDVISNTGEVFRTSKDETVGFTVTVSDGERSASRTVAIDVPTSSVALGVPCKKIVAGYAANLPVNLTFAGETAEIVMGLYKPDGTCVDTVTMTENGKYTFKLGASDAVSGTYLIKAMVGTSVIAQEAVECVAQPENLWYPIITTEPGVTKITFSSDVSFNAAKKKVTIGGETIANSNVSESGKVITIGKEAVSGQQIVISGVKYADLFPSYSFTFTLYYQG